MDPHPHPALWAERNERLWLDGVPGQGLKPDRARKLRQDGLSFHQGKMVPDADTRPAPKGHEGIARQMLPHLWAKTIWIEAHPVVGYSGPTANAWARPMRMPCGQRMGSASQLDPASAERKAPLLFAA
jgi:hypothetical protein